MPFPVDMSLHNKSRRFDIAFDDGAEYRFSYEFLRVFSPSAEVQGHAPGEEKLQVGKMNVGIDGVDAVGNYALRFRFDSTALSIWKNSAKIRRRFGMVI